MKNELLDLTTPQKSILYTEQFYKNTSVNNVCGTIIINNELNFDLLEKAINIFVENNDSFNLKLVLDGNEIKQFKSDFVPFKVKVVDINSRDDISNIENDMVSHVFDIYSSEFLFMFKIFRLKNNSGGFILNTHHLISDSWNLGLVARQIISIYSSLINNSHIEINKDFSYINYIYSEDEYVNSNKFKKDKEYWNGIFETVPEVASIPSNIIETSDKFSCTANRKNFTISKNVMSKIASYCKTNSVSVFNFFMAIYSIYIGRVSNLDDFVIGTPILNRTNFKEKNTTGMFINIAPFRINMDSNLDFKSFVLNISKDSLAMLRHQKYSYQYILNDLRNRDYSLPSLYNIILSYQITNAIAEEGISYETRWVFNGNCADDINIHLHDINNTGNIVVAYDYKVSKYCDSDIEFMHNRILYMINQVLNNDNIFLKDICIVTSKEKYNILYNFNDTDVEYDTSKTIVNLFVEQANKDPNKTAIVCNNEKLTYKELDEKSNIVANYLIKNGISIRSIVGIMINRSCEMIIGLLGILKAGAAYLPIDPDYPMERISYMLENSEASTVLVNATTCEILPESYNKINISLDLGEDKTLPNLSIDSSSLAYLIYTSGSTGNPKGVMLTHKNIHNFILGVSKIVDFSPNKTMVSLTTICFDIFVLELWGALANGLKVVIANEIEQKDSSSFNALCLKHNVNMVQTTPSRFNAFFENSNDLDYLQNITDIMVGGEPLPKKLLDKFKTYSNANIYNMYGPTETAVWSTVKDLSYDDVITVGKPIANTTCYILDKNMNLLPPYVPGELYIGGDGVSNGYLKRDDLTCEKFVKSPFDESKTIYNTADLAYFTNDGEIVHLGRTDFQVKIRGYRVELGEIENTICMYDGIGSCVVVYNKLRNGKHALCAYYTSTNNIDIANLKKFVLNNLPSYMLPNYFIKLNELPHTPNGKIDRKSLPFDFDVEKEIVLPKNDFEIKLCEIISSIAKNSDFSMSDDLFSIGMDSINMINLSTKINSIFGVSISIKKLYEINSITELAQEICLNSVNTFYTGLKISNLSSYPLSYAQNRMFYASKVCADSTVYNICGGLLIDKILDKNKIKSVLNRLINLHRTFRTCFKIVDSTPYQFILDKVDFNVEFYNSDESNIRKIIDNFPKPFDLSCAPLLRACVYFLDNKKTLILLDSHHIAVDGVSLNILIKDFCRLYNNENIENMDFNYTDYAIWEHDFINSDSIKTYENYWLNRFNDNNLTVLNLPYDYTMSNTKSFNGNSINFDISENVFSTVDELAKKYRVSPYCIFISVFYILLYKYTSQNDIILGSPMDCRNFHELDNVVGMFVNNILLRNSIDSSKSFKEFLLDTQKIILDALSNQPYPYDLLVDKLNLNNNPLLDVVFTYQNPSKDTFCIDNSNVNIITANTKTSKFNLLLEIIPDSNSIRLEYNTDLFKFETANSFLKHYLFVLNNILNDENVLISDVDIITDEEKVLLDKFNNTYCPINDDTFVSIFENQVNKRPDDIALICDDNYLTYSELNKKANSLAHLLIENGIGANDIVCIMTNRSLETIVCMLGILKAGAAFFNVDPTYPLDRTKYYIEDSKTKYVLTQKELYDRVKDIENCIEIDLDNSFYNCNFDNPNVKVNKDDLSYVIYTSGSTGTPKGVMLNQVGVANMVKAMTKVLDYLKEGNKHTIASVTSTPFDIFVYEILVSLAHGLKVVMANNAEHRNPKLLDALIRKYNVDVMTVTPSLMKINYDNREPNSALAYVKNMVFGGEPLPEKFVNDLRALADDITIYNIYGPSEITVLSNVQNLDNEAEITVGPPIMNTQIHILDKNMKRLPIGVVGEIYISGIQVGHGYIGKPDLTKEKFMQNPFGKGMIYKSGDIGRWTFDGKVQCLGRVDHQIKLRGLRIELGEIESRMCSIPGVSASVVNKIEIDGKEVLCGYYVADSDVSEKLIKDTLRSSLPYYMVPTYILRLDEMPYTINRKIDRKSLPLPELNRSISASKTDISALSSNEEKLLQIWKDILKIDDIHINDNFFDIGGDSISAINMQIEAVKYGLNFEYADIFNYPTIEQLSKKIPPLETAFIREYDYSKINKILARNTIDNLSTIKPANIKNILLIGSTGFLGAHIIDEFMKSNSGIIYCLVRPKDNMAPTTRLKNALRFYFGNKYDNEFSKRIIVLNGDLIESNLGLSVNDYNLIKNNIDVVINSGAVVKHFGLKDMFENINVNGTRNIVEFCKREHVRLIHISTTSVSGNGEKEETVIETPENINNKKIFTEKDIYVGQNIEGIYTTTKYRAELIVLEAIYDGLDAQILRIGNITNRYSDGVFQSNVENNAFAKRIKSFVEIGAFPKYMLKHAVELAPVDLVANAIIKILNYTSVCNVFHIYNTKLMQVKLLIDTLNELGLELLPVSNEMLSNIIAGILTNNDKKDVLSGIIYDLDEKKRLIYTSNIRLNADFTKEYLSKLSFDWKDIDKDYIIKYINYFIGINFLNGGKNDEDF